MPLESMMNLLPHLVSYLVMPMMWHLILKVSIINLKGWVLIYISRNRDKMIFAGNRFENNIGTFGGAVLVNSPDF